MNKLLPAAQYVRPERYCVIGLALQSLPKQHRTALTEQLDTNWRLGGPTDYEISETMLDAGLRSSPTSVNRHRGSKCVCPKGNK
jgi:hypothetical protein